MVRYDFVALNVGNKIMYGRALQILCCSGDMTLFLKKKLFTEILKQKFLSIGKFQSEISPELRRIDRCMPEALF